ncbi:MAG: AAA family ATPase, partial [Myxococcales bacterium]|nr:AAA family ATPase [Myxococcales bacterium]
MATQTIERSTLTEVAQLAADVRGEVQKAFYGGPEPIELILTTLMARGHVLLEGVPGIAKTTLVKAFAAVLGCSFRRIQFTPDLLPSDITGT